MSKSFSTVETQSSTNLQIGAWIFSLAITVLAIIAWGMNFGWKLNSITAYQVFPLLGLIAFSLMWTHYVVGTVRDLLHVPESTLKAYYRITGYAVLALICLHPAIIIYQRYRDGFGLPPHSYETYVAPGLGWVTLLGTASFFVFIAYEFRRFFGGKPWWHFVTEAGDVAMLAIVYHGVKIGDDLQQGWYRVVWLFFGISLIIILARSYYLKYGVEPKSTAVTN